MSSDNLTDKELNDWTATHIIGWKQWVHNCECWDGPGAFEMWKSDWKPTEDLNQLQIVLEVWSDHLVAKIEELESELGDGCKLFIGFMQPACVVRALYDIEARKTT